MPEIAKITLPSGTTYYFKDETARAAIAGGTSFLGVTTTALTDGATTAQIVIDGQTVSAINGGIAIYNNKEFIYASSDSKWHEIGDTTDLGDLAYKDTATGSYTPEGTVSAPTFTGSSSDVTITAADNTSGNYQPKGTVSKPTFTGEEMTATGSFTPSGSVTVTTNATTNKTATVAPASSGTATYTPGGDVSAPTINVATAGSTATVNSITDVGSLPALTFSVADENLTISWSAGTLPTKGENQTVKTGDAAYTASKPTFTGTGVRLVTGNIAVPNTYTANFSGTAGEVSVSGTPAGSISQPTFTGTKAQLSGTTTAAGSVSQPTFTGTAKNVTVS